MGFKRGFLNSKKGRDALAIDSTSASGLQSKPPGPEVDRAGDQTDGSSKDTNIKAGDLPAVNANSSVAEPEHSET